jgi:glycosyltransferase involved in cell wall biosynthesis
MKISIITVCYNEAATIEKTLESIFSQTYKNIESIVIDGGSTDGTLDIIEKYKDKIAYFVSEPDEGIYNAMNKGIKASVGEVLYFLNGNDTLYSNDVLETVANTFKKGNYDFVYSDINVIYPDKNTIKKHNKGINYHRLLSLQICHQAVFYKKTLFDKFGLYDENFFIAADHDFNMKIWTNRKTKTFYLNKTLANFDKTGFSSDKKNKKILKIENSLIFYKYALSASFLKINYYIKLYFADPLILFKSKKLYQYINRLHYFRK